MSPQRYLHNPQNLGTYSLAWQKVCGLRERAADEKILLDGLGRPNELNNVLRKESGGRKVGEDVATEQRSEREASEALCSGL